MSPRKSQDGRPGSPTTRRSTPSSRERTAIRSRYSVCTAARQRASVRVFWPGAEVVAVIDCADGEMVADFRPPAVRKASSRGRPAPPQPFAYRLRLSHGGDTWEAEDPYRFPMILGEMDVYLIGEGSHRRLFERLGAHPMTIEGVAGVGFRRVGAQCIAGQRGRRFQPVGRPPPSHAQRIEAGVWELFVPGVAKAPSTSSSCWLPMAACCRSRPIRSAFITSCRRRPARASRPAALRMVRPRLDGEPQGAAGARRAIAAYEVHLGSWRRKEDNAPLSYDELGRPAGLLRPRHGLHPYRMHAGLGVSLLRFLGLPADRPVRPDQPLRQPGGFCRLRRQGATKPASASSSTGCRRTFPATFMASPASTAPRSTSTRTRASAFIATGTRSSTI